MEIHPNTKLTPQSRAEIGRRVLEESQSPTVVAAAFGVSVRTVHKWLARYRAEGGDGLRDRSSRPHGHPRALPATVVARVVALCRQRWTGAQIADALKVSPSGPVQNFVC